MVDPARGSVRVRDRRLDAFLSIEVNSAKGDRHLDRAEEPRSSLRLGCGWVIPYFNSAEEMRQRLNAILNHPDYTTLVAESSQEVVGLVGCYVGCALEFTEPYGRLRARQETSE